MQQPAKEAQLPSTVGRSERHLKKLVFHYYRTALTKIQTRQTGTDVLVEDCQFGPAGVLITRLMLGSHLDKKFNRDKK